jgi:phenylalanine-4-hydroxylase
VVEPPSAPVHEARGLRGDYSRAAPDYTVEQQWRDYSEDEHAIWAQLYARQIELTERFAAPEFLQGVRALGASATRIPRFEDANRVIGERTGWRIVAVPGLIPEQTFFDHLAHQRFPVTVWIRRREELDYLVEPDVFHDFFGHVPLLTIPAFARFMQAYGEAGPKALAIPGALAMLSRLYWYMVEFGLIGTATGLRVYGAGILSSKGETVYSIESPQPRRLKFDLLRVMRTEYRIDAFQQNYFVLESFEQLFESCYGTDFAPLYRRYAGEPPLPADANLPGDRTVPAAIPIVL